MNQFEKQWLLLDADDTLWENNIYFERAIDEFMAFVDHPHYTHAEVRDVLNRIERANAAVHGYGSVSFGRNLREAFCRLASDRATPENLAHVASLAAAIRDRRVEVIPGVPETLEYLSGRHRLVLFTKGDPEEQHSKVERSGLGGFFADLRVVREKDAYTYGALAQELGAPAGQVWMVGNSPRSDINPALAAGLNAVWVPHDATWVLEKEDIVPGPGKLLVLSRFAELRDYF